jgi:hypothetical protein
MKDAVYLEVVLQRCMYSHSPCYCCAAAPPPPQPLKNAKKKSFRLYFWNQPKLSFNF